MAYTRTYWQNEMVISTENLNKIEQGISDLDNKTEKIDNMVNVVNSDSSNVTFPSAKAVYDLFCTIPDVTSKKY